MAAALMAALDNDDQDRLRQLAADPDAREAISVLIAGDPTTREYAPAAVRVVLGSGGVPLLLKLLDDRDPDVRGMALEELAAISPSELAKQVPRMRRRLTKGDDWEGLSVAWRLAVLNDRESIPLIMAYRDRHPATAGFHKGADVILAFMLDRQSVIDRIAAHDHEHMRWLAHAASLVNTDEARSALRQCARAAPDEDCRAICQHKLAE